MLSELMSQLLLMHSLSQSYRLLFRVIYPPSFFTITKMEICSKICLELNFKIFHFLRGSYLFGTKFLFPNAILFVEKSCQNPYRSRTNVLLKSNATKCVKNILNLVKNVFQELTRLERSNKARRISDVIQYLIVLSFEIYRARI